MILCNLAVLLAERKLKIADVVKDTGISRTTLTVLYYGGGKGVQFETANTLCKYLDVDINDLFTFVPFDYKVGTVEYDVDTNKGTVILEISTRQRNEQVKLNFTLELNTLPITDDNKSVSSELNCLNCFIASDMHESDSEGTLLLYKLTRKVPTSVKKMIKEDLFASIVSEVCKITTLDISGDSPYKIEVETGIFG